MTELAVFSGKAGSTGTFRRLAGLQRILAVHWRRGVSGHLSAEAQRDSGARRVAQDYALAASLEAASPRRLQRIADRVQWSLPRP